MTRFVKEIAVLFVASLLAQRSFAAPAALPVVNLPAMTIWCASEEIVSGSDATASADSARQGAMKTLDDVIEKAGLSYSGIPFVTLVQTSAAQAVSSSAASATSTTSPPSQAPAPAEQGQIRACATVPNPAPALPTAPVVVETLPAGQYIFMPCGHVGTNEAGAEQKCITAIRKELADAQRAAKKGDASYPPVLVTRIAKDASPASIIAAYASASDRATNRSITLTQKNAFDQWGDPDKKPRPLRTTSDASIGTAGDPQASFVIVAVPIT